VLYAAATAAQVVGELRAAQAVDPLIRLLTSDGGAYWAKQEAARSLGLLAADVDDTDPIVDALLHGQGRMHGQAAVQRTASRALVKIGGPYTVERLAETPSAHSARALGRLPAQHAAPALLEWLARSQDRDDLAGVRACVEALGTLRAMSAAPAMAELATTSQYDDVRALAVRALGRTDPDAHIDALLLAVSDPQLDVRRHAARALANCHDRRAVIGLLTLLSNGSGLSVVLQTLTDRPDPRAVHALLGVFRTTTQRRTRNLAAHALRAVAPQAPLLAGQISALMDDFQDPELKRAAACLLGQLGARQEVFSLLLKRNDDYERIRAAAVTALGQLGPPAEDLTDARSEEVEAAVEAALADPSHRVRIGAVAALRSWSRPSDLPLLQTAARDDHPHVRAAAMAALRRFPT
jgi:HEAT repeat protein